MGLFGGKKNKGAEQAAKNEADRQRQIEGTTARINQIFGAPQRQAQYADFLSALRSRYTDGLNRQKSVADLHNTFATARQGLTGGSEDVSRKRKLGETYQEGLVDAESKAQGAVGDLKSRDDATRLELTGLASGGMDATTAASRAISGLRTNTSAALENSIPNGIGDVFGGFADAYGKQQTAKAYREGRDSAPGSLYGKI